MKYELVLEEHPGYVHAIGKGARTADNARRFLREAGEAALRLGSGALLVEVRFIGSPLDTGKIFEVMQDRYRDGLRLRKVAYVEASAEQASRARFAETVARNRGVNVRLFTDVEAARAWLLEEEKAP